MGVASGTITSHDDWWSVGADMAGMGASAPSDAAVWPTANLALYVPFYVPETIIIKRVFWSNGSTVSGNVDMGIYDDAGTRIASTGSTAQSGTTAPQTVALAATLTAGMYYLGLAMDNISGRITRATGGTGGIGILVATGMVQEASAFPLPNPATFAALTTNYMPLFGVMLRSGTVI